MDCQTPHFTPQDLYKPFQVLHISELMKLSYFFLPLWIFTGFRLLHTQQAGSHDMKADKGKAAADDIAFPPTGKPPYQT